jgi:hypothetical protein
MLRSFVTSVATPYKLGKMSQRSQVNEQTVMLEKLQVFQRKILQDIKSPRQLIVLHVSVT